MRPLLLSHLTLFTHHASHLVSSVGYLREGCAVGRITHYKVEYWRKMMTIAGLLYRLPLELKIDELSVISYHTDKENHKCHA
jgi:hypothetical protein